MGARTHTSTAQHARTHAHHIAAGVDVLDECEDGAADEDDDADGPDGGAAHEHDAHAVLHAGADAEDGERDRQHRAAGAVHDERRGEVRLRARLERLQPVVPDDRYTNMWMD